MSDSVQSTANSANFQAVAARSSTARSNATGANGPVIPTYLSQTYHWAYLDERNARYLDHELVVKTILWRQHRRLEQAAFAEISPGQRVLQSACVYGRFSNLLAEHIGPDGQLEVVDVAALQVRRCHEKLASFTNTRVRHEDVRQLPPSDFEVACCYFLLHELPDDAKSEAIAALLRSIRPGGKVVFVDYHKPHWAHPAKLLTSAVFKLFEPYAKGLWHKEVETLAGPHSAEFQWHKETFFGGLFQKVVVSRKE